MTAVYTTAHHALVDAPAHAAVLGDEDGLSWILFDARMFGPARADRLAADIDAALAGARRDNADMATASSCAWDRAADRIRSAGAFLGAG